MLLHELLNYTGNQNRLDKNLFVGLHNSWCYKKRKKTALQKQKRNILSRMLGVSIYKYVNSVADIVVQVHRREPATV